MATQARSNIAVSNDCVSNVFTVNALIAINDVDRTSACQVAPLRITLDRNEDSDFAEFDINRDEGFTPTAGQIVEIALGDSENVTFGGQIMSLSHVREKSGESPRFHVVCRDWTALFNRRLITYDFSGQSATDIANTIVTTYTSGFFTYGIKPAMVTIEEFFCINEKPLSAIRRLANLVKGGCDLDARRIVHLWDSGGPTSSYTPSNPAELTNSLHSLKSFTPQYDFTQVRTRVIVEGKQTTCPLSIPADVTLPNSSFPVEDSTAFSATGGAGRIGTQRFTYTTRNYPVVPGLNSEGTFVAADAAAGATSLEVNSIAFLISTGTEWFQAGDQVLHLEGASSGPPATINIPAAGLGSLQHALGAGESIRALGTISGVAGLTLAQDVGAEVVVQVEEDDAAAQATVAALEGGDGIHEHLVVDGRLSTAGAEERANNELDAFSASLLSAEWVTHDLQTVPGTLQAINLSSPSVLAATLLVDSVVLEFPVDNTRIASSPTTPCDSNLWPRRTVRGSTVKVAAFFDVMG